MPGKVNIIKYGSIESDEKDMRSVGLTVNIAAITPKELDEIDNG